MRYDRKFLSGLLALVFLVACTQTPEQRAKEATVLIIAANADGNISSGSGFFVETDKIATNIHVVDSGRMLFAVGTKKVYNIEKVTGYDPERDLVVLKVSGKGKPLELGEGKIKKGDPIFAVGYPGGGYARTEGVIHGIRESDKELRLTTTDFPNKSEGAVTAPGNSGGPILNRNGQVIGVAVASYVSESNTRVFSFAIAPGSLQALLRSSEPAVRFSEWQGISFVTAHIYGARADKQSDSGEYKKAVKGFDKAIKLYPDYAEFYVDRGRTKNKLGFYQEAIQDFDKAIELIPDNFTAYYNRGFAKLQTDDYAGGIQDFNDTLELNPDHADAYVERGNAKVSMSEPDYAGAIKDYDKAIDNLNRKDVESYIKRGNAKLEGGNYEGAIQDYTQAIKLNPKDAAGYINRGLAKAKKPSRDYIGAIEDYKTAINLNPDYTKLKYAYYYRGNAKKSLGQNADAKQDRAKAYYYEGKANSNNRQYQAAVKSFDKAIALNSDYTEAYYARGNAQTLGGNYKVAIIDYTKTIDFNPDFAEAYYARGNAQASLESDDYQKVIKDYTEAIKRKPDFAEAYYNQGVIWHRLGESQKAIDDFSKAIKLKEPAVYAKAYKARAAAKEALREGVEAKQDLVIAYYYWGDEAHTAKQYQKAIDNFNMALKSIPDLAHVHDAQGNAKTELGKSKADLGDLEGALKLYQAAIDNHDEAIKLDPETAQYYVNRGGTKFWRSDIRVHNDYNGMIEDYESAINDFKKAIERESDSTADICNLRGQVRCMLGYAKANQGNSKKAREQYKLALKDFKKANKLDSNNVSYYRGLGLANAALGKAKAAIDAFEKAKQLEEAKVGN